VIVFAVANRAKNKKRIRTTSPDPLTRIAALKTERHALCPKPSATSLNQNHFPRLHFLSRLQALEINAARRALCLPLHVMLACTLFALNQRGDLLPREVEDFQRNLFGLR